MLYRKIASLIENHIKQSPNTILLVDGARQVGKTYIIRYVCGKLFKNFVEINMAKDLAGGKFFQNVNSVNDLYFRISSMYGQQLGTKDDTIIFLDEIQTYPNLFALLKFLVEDGRYTFIASGSLLGVALADTPSIPMGSVREIRMYPLDFEEFLYANGFNNDAINAMKEKFSKREPLEESVHNEIMDMFKKYLLVGGLPDAVNKYIETHNIREIRNIHKDIHKYYGYDASKYGEEKKLLIKRIYDMIPSNMENKKKRVIIKEIEQKKGKTSSCYVNEFEYLTNSGIALDVKAVSNPVFSLAETEVKNLTKLYMNDVGILTYLLYGNNIKAVLENEKSINLGAVYETVVAQELVAHGHSLYYYDNRNKGEVDFLINDFASLSVIPIEVKSGRDYLIHSALNTFVSNDDYHTKEALVLSNERVIRKNGKIIYLPIYDVMFIDGNSADEMNCIF